MLSSGRLTKTSGLSRFLIAQDRKSVSGKTLFEQAISELEAGRKRSHWIWFIFPQCEGLGLSQMAVEFSLDVSEAEEYLKHPILSERYLQALKAVEKTAGKEKDSLLNLFQSKVDVLKFVSSATLFHIISTKSAEENEIVKEVNALTIKLLKVAVDEGEEPCGLTQSKCSLYYKKESHSE